MKTLNKKIILSIALFIFCFVFRGGALAQETDLDGDGVPDDIDACYNPAAPSGLVSYWGFEDGSGTTAVDSYNANPGSLINGPVWTTGKVGGALSFDTATDYVKILDSDQFTLSGDYTVEAWINPEDTANAWKAIMGTYPFSPPGVWGGGFILSLGNGDDNELSFWANGLWGYSGYEIKEDGNWKHIVYTTSSGSVGTFYVDGVSVSTVAATTITNGVDLHIGDGGEQWAEQDFYGLIDEVAIYDRALSAEEIADHYNNGLGKCYCGPAVIYVDPGATGANDGTSWANAYNYLQNALAVAVSLAFPAEIRVAEGTYYPDANTAEPNGSGDRTATFELINGVGLYGGYAGYGAADPNERDWQTNETILSGDLDSNDVQGLDPCDLLDEPTRAENSYHVVIGSGTDATAVLDGFIITAGNANGADTNSEGAGMRNYVGGPTVANCTFSENSAADAGGGMDNDSGDAIVVNCTFSRNAAMADGGGMCNDNYDFQDGSPTVTNCTFNENWARWGGGMSNYDDSKTVVSNCVFRNNSAEERGGAMDNDVSTPTITNCTFSGNSAGADGGGMNNENSSPVVTNCAFIGNATEDGGGMCNCNSSPTVTNCTFTGNSAISPDVYVLGGGAMCNVEYSSPTITNCILWGNSSPEPNGPQIALKDNCTVSISYCDLQGGQDAIYNDGTSSIIWGTGNIDDDPLFIGPNGLDGIPDTADDEENNVHLRGYSPCINAGDPGGDYNGQVDIDRQPRVAYGQVDMGADEIFPIAGDFEPDGDVDWYDFAYFANNWLLGVE